MFWDQETAPEPGDVVPVTDSQWRDLRTMAIVPPSNAIRATTALRAMDVRAACDVIEALFEAYPACFVDPERLHDLANKLSRRADQIERERA